MFSFKTTIHCDTKNSGEGYHRSQDDQRQQEGGKGLGCLLWSFTLYHRHPQQQKNEGSQYHTMGWLGYHWHHKIGMTFSKFGPTVDPVLNAS